jgi:hypothetical protein
MDGDFRASIPCTCLKATKSSREVNAIYWIDVARNCEAYSVMTCWRGIELIKSAIRAPNIREVIPPAVLSRSLLELSATFLWNAHFIEKNLSVLHITPETAVVSADLEGFIVKSIWGTRLGEPEEHLKQTNVLTTIKKLSKNSDASQLLPVYEYLCEIAHPNVIGNARFWSHVDQTYSDATERVIISRSPDPESIRETVENVLWAIGGGPDALEMALRRYPNPFGSCYRRCIDALLG